MVSLSANIQNRMLKKMKVLGNVHLFFLFSIDLSDRRNVRELWKDPSTGMEFMTANELKISVQTKKKLELLL